MIKVTSSETTMDTFTHVHGELPVVTKWPDKSITFTQNTVNNNANFILVPRGERWVTWREKVMIDWYYKRRLKAAVFAIKWRYIKKTRRWKRKKILVSPAVWRIFKRPKFSHYVTRSRMLPPRYDRKLVLHPAPNPYSYNLVRETHPRGVYTSPFDTRSGGQYQAYCSPSWDAWSFKSSYSEHLSDVEYKAYQKLFAKITTSAEDPEAYKKHNSLVDTFESPELARTWKQVADAVKVCRRLANMHKIARRLHPLATLSTCWLFWQYGLKPLVSSLNELMALLKKWEVGFESEKIKVTSMLQQVYEGPSTPGAEAQVSRLGSAGDDSVSQVLATRSIRVSYQFDRKLVDLGLQTKTQFGLNAPNASMYMSMRLTFVLDWLIDIGNWLEQVEILRHGTGYEYTNGIKSTTVYTRIMRSKHAVNPELGLSCNVQSMSAYVNHKRELLSDIPPPSAPTFRLRLNGGKITSLAAMIYSSIHSTKRVRK